jgi:putative pyruvate formate lyase activating enzyme
MIRNLQKSITITGETKTEFGNIRQNNEIKNGVINIADMMLNLQRRGCHNINIVTPTHYSPHILQALDVAADKGLRMPLVWNTCGWEKTDVLQLLDGVVDIYLADFKYDDADAADKYSPGAASYPEVTKAALLEMHRQVGVAHPDQQTGLMNRGLMIRHLVMPNNVARSEKVMKWIGENLPKDTYVNIMSQYRPMFKANQYPEISRSITRSEYNAVVNAAHSAGLTNLRLQG